MRKGFCPADLLAALFTHTTSSQPALQARPRRQKQGWVFASKRSATGHLCPNVSRPFAKMRKETGISDRLVPYSARHTFVTAMLEMTGDIAFVGRLLGHKIR